MLETPRDVFHHELRQLLYVERTLADEVLPELREHVHDEGLKTALAAHRTETEQHVANVERVFELLAAVPRPEESPALEGLREEHDEGMKQLDGDHELTFDLFHVGVVAKGEHLEIAVYENLIATAERMGEAEVAELLRENLEQEQAALRLAEQVLDRLLRAVPG